MCPVCIAAAALVAGSATGTGGLTALVGHGIFKSRRVLINSSTEKEGERWHPQRQKYSTRRWFRRPNGSRPARNFDQGEGVHSAAR